MAEIVRQMEARHQRTAQLLKETDRLRRELLSVCLASERIGVRTKRLLSLARRVTLAPLLTASVLTPTAPTGTFLCTACLT
jgi:hypothetical protein